MKRQSYYFNLVDGFCIVIEIDIRASHFVKANKLELFIILGISFCRSVIEYLSCLEQLKYIGAFAMALNNYSKPISVDNSRMINQCRSSFCKS